jgi:hypothetical protein
MKQVSHYKLCKAPRVYQASLMDAMCRRLKRSWQKAFGRQGTLVG